MRELMNVYPGHPAAVYDPRWLGYVDFPELNENDLTSDSLVDQIFEYYQESLLYNPRAMAFLKMLGISDRQLLKQWGVGFSDRTLGKQLPQSDTWEGDWLRGKLQRNGLLIASGGEFFRGALVFPNIDNHGKVCEAYGERITPKLRSGTPYHLYWSNKPAGFFNQQVLGYCREVFLCKNPLDALIVDAAGHSNVVALLGMRSFDTQQLDRLINSPVQTVTLVFDNTREGDRTSRLMAQALAAYDIASNQVVLPVGEDLKRCVLKHGPDSLPKLINNTQPCVQTYKTMQEDIAW